MDNIINKIIEFGENNDEIVGIILTSSRVKPDSEIDFLSDYDIEVFIDNFKKFEQDDWLCHFGDVMVKWPELVKVDNGYLTRLVLFEDKSRIDFQITNTKPTRTSYLNGYKVLVDKEGIFDYLEKPTYKEYALKKPTNDEYQSLTKEFFWDLYYVYKYLYRENLGFSKYMIDTVIRNEYLHVLLDFYVASKHGYDVEVGRFGKDYKKYLNSQEYAWYLETYSSLSFASILKSADSLLNLYSSIAKKLGNKLDYKYPHKTHNLVMSFCEEILNKYNDEKNIKTLDNLTLDELWELFPIKVKPHNSDYKVWYEEESKRIMKTLTNKVFRINHIGSTAIKGLIAKPTVDILLEVYEGVSFEEITKKLATIGYIVTSKQTKPFYRFVLNKGYTKYGYEDRVFHLHLRYPSNWNELYFRDYLLENQSTCDDYGVLKEALALEYKHHRDNYTNAKSDFIDEVTLKAKKVYGNKYDVE